MSNVFLTNLVNNSPYKITVFVTIWGDFKRTGNEEWDDGNIITVFDVV